MKYEILNFYCNDSYETFFYITTTQYSWLNQKLLKRAKEQKWNSLKDKCNNETPNQWNSDNFK